MYSSLIFTSEQVEEILKIAQDAGKVIFDLYQKVYNIEMKMDGSPVTLADQQSNDIITTRLSQLVSYPLISEENKQDEYAIRKNWKRYWLIDPLDGTKEFIQGRREFTVNIALIENNKPIFGVIYAPAYDELFWAEESCGSFFRYNNKTILLKNNASLSYKEGMIYNPTMKNLKLVASRSHGNDTNIDNLFDNKKSFDIQNIAMGSSLKFCRLAQGKIDCYIRKKPTWEWDTAAGHIILKESGGDVLDYMSYNPLQYNKENLLNPFFVALY